MGSPEFSWKLADHPRLPKGKTVAVVVLDGWGEANPHQYNCTRVADTPTGAPERWRLPRAHGTAVGLPTDDDTGNSEVGHNALGAGRIYAQGNFNHSSSSMTSFLQLLLEGASEHGAKRIHVHILTDGRDVLDRSSVRFVEIPENELSKLREKGIDAQIASGGGWMYVTMDRYENDWGVVKRGWDAQVLGEAPYKFQSALEAIKKLREDPKANDQYLPPFVIVDESGKAVGPIVDGDAVVTFNFRADQMFMIAKALEYENFDKVDRVRFPKIRYAGMLQYDGELKLPSHYLVSPPEIEKASGEYLVHNGIKTFACRWSTVFDALDYKLVKPTKMINSFKIWILIITGYFDPSMEEYVEMPSDKGISFNVQPKMKALEIAERARDAILSGKFHQVCINLANGDMISDHGNAEDMVKRDKSGQPLLDKDGNIQILTSHALPSGQFSRHHYCLPSLVSVLLQMLAFKFQLRLEAVALHRASDSGRICQMLGLPMLLLLLL
ncbi:2,3-bisphosphoglycerate-independent phosphoglycerate mutase [Musa troglodytarum]|uniref:phosphoglycerate mutase (2,3-diphosphoglycerate-independent) n=1 Tax=Musa troglodytarum TaxID=320322 RepID=A0A9E7HJM3_9LILI|nr:2,3-bisphosphoglycerate-independent phosphoglycerate mutase [Musa troglodytarum]